MTGPIAELARKIGGAYVEAQDILAKLRDDNVRLTFLLR